MARRPPWRRSFPSSYPRPASSRERLDRGVGAYRLFLSSGLSLARRGIARITAGPALSLPRRGRASDISAYVAPLRQEALSAQTAAIDAVSGASYTRQGYAQSLQSARDAAR